MSSPLPGSFSSLSQQPSRHRLTSSSFFASMNQMGSGSNTGGQSLVRPLSPTLAGLSALHGQQQQQQQSLQSQASPNTAFLAGFSSRLTSRTYQPPTRGSGLDIFDSMQGIPSGSSSFGFRSGGNFGIPVGNNTGPPSTFDINEFPTLGGSGHQSGNLIGGSAPGSNRPNYVGQLVKDNASNDYNKPAFDMNYNDFPALPGASIGGGTNAGNANNNTNANVGGGRDVNDGAHFSGLGLGGNLGSGFHSQSVMNAGTSDSSISGMSAIGRDLGKQGKSRGIQTTKDGRVTNIPMGMVTDQFGMIGLLTFLRVADSDPNLVSLALGTDLTNLKLDLNSSDTLYSSFPGPWSDQPLRPYEIDYPVPSEYLIHSQIKDKLASLKDKLSRYGEDILFFLFYMFPNDYNQIAASQELFHRDWRYHKDEKIWITRAPGFPPTDKSQTYERGTYIFFDPTNWRKQPKEFLLEYDRLENRVVSVGMNLSAASMPGIAA